MNASRKRKSSRPVKKIPYQVIDLTGTCSGTTGDIIKQTKSVDDHAPELKRLLNQACFYIHLHSKDTDERKVKPKLKSKPLSFSCVGEFRIFLTDDEHFIPEVKDYWLYISENAHGEHFIYQELKTTLKSYYTVRFSASSIPQLISKLAVGVSQHPAKDALKLVFNIDETKRFLNVQVLINSKSMVDLEVYDEFVRINNRHACSIQAALALTGNAELPSVTDEAISEPEIPHIPSRRHNLQALYSAVKFKSYLSTALTPRLDDKLDVDLGVASEASSPAVHDSSKNMLLRKLRPYQLDAVRWMIAKEKGNYADAYIYDMQKLFSPIANTDMHVNSDSGVVIHRVPHLSHTCGGILADEMGLGKTVEVLTCMVCHPRPDLHAPTPLADGECCVMDSAAKAFFRKWDPQQSLDRSKSTQVHSSTQHSHNSSSHAICTEDSKLDGEIVQTESVNGEVEREFSVKEETAGSRDLGAPTALTLKESVQTNIRQSDVNTQTSSQEINITSPVQILPSQSALEMDCSSQSTRSLINGERNPSNDVSEMAASESNEPAKFECACGAFAPNMVKVQCSLCSLQQHAACVGYDVMDPLRGEYKCPHCHAISAPIQSGATLIIAPASIRHQWREEIIKHVGSSQLKVLEYEGVSPKSYIQPMTLARQDIVITTYGVLRAELRSTKVPHSNSEAGRRFRKPKRFMAMPSPLTAIQWWRVCLDEAQMVESVNNACSEMAHKLAAVNRWCVTGTPISSAVNDLYGLFVFLGITPFYAKPVWDAFLFRPYCFGLTNNLFTVLRHVMWRNSKNDVRDQLGLPAQSEVMHNVMFSPVEEVFYRHEYAFCKNRFHKVLQRFHHKNYSGNTRLDMLLRWDLNGIMASLVDMRKACCHPGVAQNKNTKLSSQKTLTMAQLLEQMTRKGKVLCDEAHRSIVASLNGQAACHIMKQEYVKAIEKYMEVISPVKKYEDIETDKLQMIHALHNFRDLLMMDAVAPHDRCVDINTLQTDKDSLVEKYIAKPTSAIDSLIAEQTSKLKQDVFNDALMSDPARPSTSAEMLKDVTTSAVFNLLSIGELEYDLLRHVKNAVGHLQGTETVSRLSTAAALRYYLVTGFDKMMSCHRTASDAVAELVSLGTDPEFVSEVVNCCLRPDPSAPSADSECRFCRAEATLKRDEYALFAFSGGYLNEAGLEERKGTWADSIVECVFNSLLSYIKHNHSSVTSVYHSADVERDERFFHAYLECGASRLKLIDNMKKHFKALRVLWMRLRERVAAVDELSMATLRFRLKQEWETDTSQSVHIVEQHQLEPLHLKQISDMMNGDTDLSKALRQLNYLKHLAAQPIDSVEGNTELCPICQQALGHSWAVLVCFHSFCIECIRVLSNRRQQSALPALGSGRQVIRCAVCRENTRNADISYVSSGKTINPANDDIQVKGNHSSKVTEVIRCLKTIEREEPDAKALVFSTWSALLDVVAHALDDNQIAYRQLASGRQSKNYEQTVNSFRRNAGIEALLLPVASGANGLNLTEATHVLLLEPLLSPGKEAQAIGRIHRIGQTRPTFVHRFIVRHTIEEKIHSVLSAMSIPGEDDSTVDNMPLTLADLSELFDIEWSDVSRQHSAAYELL